MDITLRNKEIYNRISIITSQVVTYKYSTSFSLSIYLLDKSIREAIFGIYGFVRLGDEIVDTFTEFNRKELLEQFKMETLKALDNRVSLNPVLHHFQQVVHRYEINRDLVHAFFDSMEMDLSRKDYERNSFDSYIYGSAEVVGLMCLNVFCEGRHEVCRALSPYATRLGAAFQKVNFLRDIHQDTRELNRTYFPHFQNGGLNNRSKLSIEKEIENDFNAAYEGIQKLPAKARLGVYVAYVYYRHLFKKLRKASPEKIFETRIRVSNIMKFYLLLKTMVRHKVRGI